ncbi:BZ3500_MvSof-1268-A1-R1_Chr10-1g02627 [Microbotryum saponariae]|uniref:BZ3500_MvSof-1268-A1-R1_Chr10-1g02627 protein n=1 Tax=Microbotryum saponariae TaxID=289078 RepID=A0A2X0NJS7_9BASI|nr:BZ3500_MvSof-1268-A1-R1_Chr10-1g02627 [Microbotryum saponariae]SDA06116.1 BZ3501_MvSof-1269-A2-R1_Chr10-1g02228 [Microbotryum saponariae]
MPPHLTYPRQGVQSMFAHRTAWRELGLRSTRNMHDEYRQGIKNVAQTSVRQEVAHRRISVNPRWIARYGNDRQVTL